MNSSPRGMSRPRLRSAPELRTHVARNPIPESEAPIITPAQEAPVTPIEEPLRSKPAPLRPPLSAGGAAPLHPPLRTGPVPARPVPTPRPGQILSGPRQPLPPATPAAPMPPASVTLPAHPVARTAPPPSRKLCSTGQSNPGNAVASAASPESRRTAGRASRGASASRYGGAPATTTDSSGAWPGAATSAPAGHAYSQYHAGPRPAHLSRAHSSRPAGNAWTRCRRRPSWTRRSWRPRSVSPAPHFTSHVASAR